MTGALGGGAGGAGDGTRGAYLPGGGTFRPRARGARPPIGADSGPLAPAPGGDATAPGARGCRGAGVPGDARDAGRVRPAGAVACRVGVRVSPPVRPGTGPSPCAGRGRRGWTVPRTFAPMGAGVPSGRAESRARGKVRVAGTMEFDRDPDRFRQSRVDAIVAAARPCLPEADWEHREQEWMGPRPMTTGGLPLIGPLPGRPGVVLAAGHNMLGLMPAPATGRLVTGLLTGKPDDSLPPGFAPGRAVRRGLGPSAGRV
ncbi:NAD(P)/FAD-dependent oxidoreductase [Streptomyces mirabilis]|uniref:NAD(P)/FAD-dependent oxidoreductase n=1 Tax=Streptomyces mirabilis TaxID=68239 RepID=UPI003809E986